MLSLESKYEKELGISTSRIKKSDDKDNFHYQAASYMSLLKVLGRLPLHLKNEGFIDYGCGKGRALFCAERNGFNRLIGVDLDRELLVKAEENLNTYTKKRAGSAFQFINENALTYEIPEGTSTFYFFNPFSEKVMSEVAGRVVNYSNATKQKVYVVYLNPKYKSVWTKAGFTIEEEIKTRFYTEALLYSYTPANYR
jgi:SAM-dependent methyltransferase